MGWRPQLVHANTVNTVKEPTGKGYCGFAGKSVVNREGVVKRASSIPDRYMDCNGVGKDCFTARRTAAEWLNNY